MFAIAWQYLNGRAVATDPTDRQKVEWPVHPDRVFQALVAAWGECGASAEGKSALEWLEKQGAPEVTCPTGDAISAREPEKVYVPVNDLVCPVKSETDFDLQLERARSDARRKGKDPHLAGTERAGQLIKQGLDLLPARSARAQRFFPCVYVGDAICALRWPQAETPAEHLASLSRLCTQVTHVGHSRAIVRMWIEPSVPQPTWVPAPDCARRGLSLRIPVPGRLSTLIAAYAGGGPDWRWPPRSPWGGYIEASRETNVSKGAFDDRLLVLRHSGGDRIHLPQTAAFTDALRKSLIAACDNSPALPEAAKAMISGHASNGLALDKSHVAFLPLAHVGSPHADGHLLGFALVLPRDIAQETEQAVFKALSRCFGNSDSGVLRLLAGSAGACELLVEDRVAPPKALQETTWIGDSKFWATVTPVVLDKLPPRRHADDDLWAAAQVAEACTRQGLPRPDEIAVQPVSRFVGAPPARAFPPLRRKSDGAKRWHVHVQIAFADLVRGPLILGAGRYRGLGLLRPIGAS